MSRFVTGLSLTLQTNAAGVPLTNREGRQLFTLCAPLVYVSDLIGRVNVPSGFVTDLSSIPRLPVVYVTLNGASDEPGVIHDYLYSTAEVPRLIADQVLREACRLIGLSAWKVAVIYAGVRAFGARNYGSSS